MKAVGTFIIFLVVFLQQNIDQVTCLNCSLECNVPERCKSHNSAFENYMEKNVIPRLEAISKAIKALSMNILPKVEIGLLPFGKSHGDVLQTLTDDGVFQYSINNDSALQLLYPTLSIGTPKFIQIMNDGSIVIGASRTNRNPTTNVSPVITGYGDDFITSGVTNPGSVYIRQEVHSNSRQVINDDINRFLHMSGNLPSFSSRFILLVTYNNVARYGINRLRYTFQVAVASDGIRSFAVFNYYRLDENAQFGVGYYDPRCHVFKGVIPKSESKNLVNTTNCDAKGKHVIVLKRYC